MQSAVLQRKNRIMILTLFCLSAAGGFLSGLLGIGGAIILIPLMYSVPPLLGTGSLTMSQVSGLTMIQVLFSSAFGCLTHMQNGNAHPRTIMTIGLPMAVMSLAGAAFSGSFNDRTMLLIFGILTAASLVLLLYSEKRGGPDSERPDFRLRRGPAAAAGAAVGLFSGILGAGGGFILVPVMICILDIPIRTAVASSLGIVLTGSIAGAAGKLMTMQVPYAYVLPVIAGSVPTAILGASISRRIPAKYLKYSLFALVAVILIKTCVQLTAGVSTE